MVSFFPPHGVPPLYTGSAITCKLLTLYSCYFRCGEIVNNNKMKTGLLLSEILAVNFFLNISEHLAQPRAKSGLSRALSST